MSEEGATNTAPELIRAVREFHRLDQEGFAQCLRVCRRTVIRWEQRGAYFSAWLFNARGNIWKDLLARYQAAEVLRIAPEGDAGEIVSELAPRMVTRVEWERPKKTKEGKGNGQAKRGTGRNRISAHR